MKCIPDRLEDLEQSALVSIEYMLSVYASEYVDCDNCLLARKCQNSDHGSLRNCTEMWRDYLEGKI